MNLSELGIIDSKRKQFIKAGIETAEDLVTMWPKSHVDRTHPTGLLPDFDEESRCLVHIKSIRYCSGRIPRIEAIATHIPTQETIKILWWNSFIWDELNTLRNQDIYISGKVKSIAPSQFNNARFEISNPSVYTTDIRSALRIYPVYRKIPGMSEQYHAQKLQLAYQALIPMSDPLSEDILRKYDLMGYQEAVYQLHWPESAEKLEAAKRRIKWNDLFYFASRLELDNLYTAQGSPFQFPILQAYRKALNNLPFTLTKDQNDTVQSILEKVQSGKRVNALVQGDVGSGKSIVAFLLMIACAENGYQAALMAPTQILAAQHYEKLRELASPLGIEVVLVAGAKLRKAEQKALESSLADGSARLIVGTQALLSQGLRYDKLALCITDEEHRYGVNQRKVLTQKAAQGVHVISMTATPIPRTLAQAVYGTQVDIYSIRTKPPGRKPVATGIALSMQRVYAYIFELVRAGQQAYVVCPMVKKNDKLEGVASVEEIYQMYHNALAPYGVRIGVVTGKMKKEEVSEVIHAFAGNQISVLVATTVIEVGVDVPNATGIIIHNAERFGLAQLHQLRGRVGRGSLESVCCLVSDFRDNERLAAMCRTSDGFELAEEDLRQRGAGDFLGTAQSGRERYLIMALTEPDEFQKTKQAAAEMLRSGQTCPLLEQAIQDRSLGKEGDILE